MKHLLATAMTTTAAAALAIAVLTMLPTPASAVGNPAPEASTPAPACPAGSFADALVVAKASNLVEGIDYAVVEGEELVKFADFIAKATGQVKPAAIVKVLVILRDTGTGYFAVLGFGKDDCINSQGKFTREIVIGFFGKPA